jgi:Anthrone oxygenase
VRSLRSPDSQTALLFARGSFAALGLQKNSMLQALQLIATFAAALFAGAALYINVAEHPARMTLETRSAAAQWAPSYKRATLMQAPLAVLSLVSGTAAWLLGADLGWFVAALLIGVVVPFTLLVIMPTNRLLLDVRRDLASAETRALLEKWNKLHAVRTALSLGASLLYLWLLYEA